MPISIDSADNRHPVALPAGTTRHALEPRHQEVRGGANDLASRDLWVGFPPEREAMDCPDSTLGEQLRALTWAPAAEAGGAGDLARNPGPHLAQDVLVAAREAGIAWRFAEHHPPGVWVAFNVGEERLDRTLGSGGGAGLRE
jgi:hypothetical protein